jgi:hypothetical protein
VDAGRVDVPPEIPSTRERLEALITEHGIEHGWQPDSRQIAAA